MSRVSVLLGLA